MPTDRPTITITQEDLSKWGPRMIEVLAAQGGNRPITYISPPSFYAFARAKYGFSPRVSTQPATCVICERSDCTGGPRSLAMPGAQPVCVVCIEVMVHLRIMPEPATITPEEIGTPDGDAKVKKHFETVETREAVRRRLPLMADWITTHAANSGGNILQLVNVNSYGVAREVGWKPSIEHTLFKCPICDDDCWIGPQQLAMFKDGKASALCALCLTAGTIVTGEDPDSMQVVTLNPDEAAIPRRT